MFLRFLIFFIIILLIEFYFFQAVKTFAQDFTQSRRQVVYWIAFVLAAFNILIGLVSLFYPPPEWNNFFRYVSSIGLILLICKLIGCSFLIIDDVFRLFRWLYALVASQPTNEQVAGHLKIDRLKFLSQAAIAFTVIPAAGFLYGILRGAYKFRVHNVKVPSKKLPQAFHGFKIVQLSDIHTGSFVNTNALHKAFDMVMDLKPDLILFTGDLVNNVSSETNGFEDAYRKLKAPYGVFSVLGNHDYGDYVSWDSPEAKQANLEQLKQTQQQVGWRLLMNEHVSLEKDGEKIALLGIENWGGNMRFPRYGKMNEAHSGTEVYPFKILMSHDPSHWSVQVTKEYTDVDLTLSGHTHGMQFGIEIPGLKWSPSKYFYPQWAGLYKQDEQFLYVNRGLGFLGYPGRLGIWPEITLIELQKA